MYVPANSRHNRQFVRVLSKKDSVSRYTIRTERKILLSEDVSYHNTYVWWVNTLIIQISIRFSKAYAKLTRHTEHFGCWELLTAACCSTFFTCRLRISTSAVKGHEEDEQLWSFISTSSELAEETSAGISFCGVLSSWEVLAKASDLD